MRKICILTFISISFFNFESGAQSYTCSRTISGSSGTIIVDSAETVCVSSNYTVNDLKIKNGGTLVVESGVTLTGNWKSVKSTGKILILGSLDINLNDESSINIENYGTLTGSLNSYKEGTIHNYLGGTINLNNSSNYIANALFINEGILNVSTGMQFIQGTIHNYLGGSINLSAFSNINNAHLLNDGTLYVTSGLEFNGVSTLVNSHIFNFSSSQYFKFNGAFFKNSGVTSISSTGGSGIMGNGLIENNGDFTIYNLNDLSAQVLNYGHMRFYNRANNISNITTINNDSLMEFINIPEVQFNGDILNNNGRFIVSEGKLKLNYSSCEIANNGIIITSDNFEVNASGAKVVNNCRILSGKNVLISQGGIFTNNGLVWANENLEINGGNIDFYNGMAGFVRGKNFINSGKVTGFGQFYFTNLTNNNGGSIKGNSLAHPIEFFDLTQTGSSIVDQGTPPENTIRPSSMTLLDTTDYVCSANATSAGFPPHTDDYVLDVTYFADTIIIDLSYSISPFDSSYFLRYNSLKLFTIGGHENTDQLIIPGIGKFITNGTNATILFIKEVGFTGSLVNIEYLIGDSHNPLSQLYISHKNLITIVKANVLPIKIGSFEADKKGNKVLLKWRTLSEKDIDYFEIERSSGESNFKAIPGKIKAKEESNIAQDYMLEDENPNKGNNLYRLKIYDIDNNVTYSEIRRLYLENIQALVEAYPIPITEFLNLKGNLNTISQISIHNLNGLAIYKNIAIQKELTVVDMRGLSDGIYLIKIIFNDGSSKTIKVLKKG